MTITEAILEGDDRNFIINFGPQHPAAHGVLCCAMISKGRAWIMTLRAMLISFAGITALTSAAHAQQMPDGVEIPPEVAAMMQNMSPEDIAAIMGEVEAEMKADGGMSAEFECRGGTLEITPTQKQEIARLEKYVKDRVADYKAEGSFDIAQNAYEFARDCSTVLPMSTIAVGPHEIEYGAGVNQNQAFRRAKIWNKIARRASQMVCADMSEDEFRAYLVNGVSRFTGTGANAASINAHAAYTDRYADLCNDVWDRVLFSEESDSK